MNFSKTYRVWLPALPLALWLLLSGCTNNPAPTATHTRLPPTPTPSSAPRTQSQKSASLIDLTGLLPHDAGIFYPKQIASGHLHAL